MTPIEALALFEAALATAQGIGRIVAAHRDAGEITQEQIDAVKARAEASDRAFDELLASLGVDATD